MNDLNRSNNASYRRPCAYTYYKNIFNIVLYETLRLQIYTKSGYYFN